MKYLLWFRNYVDKTGCAYSFESKEKALHYAMQYSPNTYVYIQNKITIVEDGTDKLIMDSREVKKLIREKYKLKIINEFNEYLLKP